MSSIQIQAFFHDDSNTISYVVTDPSGLRCAVIDPVLDFDPVSGRTGTGPLDALCDYMTENELVLDWILETHAHADHVSGAPQLQARSGGRIAIGDGIRNVEQAFGHLFSSEPGAPDAEQHFDHLLNEGESISLGETEIKVLFTPGHTPSCVTYLIADAAFVGDTLFMPDGGTARADFPGGDASQLYASIQKILELDPRTRIFVCHDYGPGGRDIAWETTVGEQRERNIHVGEGRSQPEFVSLRTERDATLSLPKLIIPAVQLNIRAGKLPEPESNGVAYVRIPIDQL